VQVFKMALAADVRAMALLAAVLADGARPAEVR
jgi:hypothetical protein